MKTWCRTQAVLLSLTMVAAGCATTGGSTTRKQEACTILGGLLGGAGGAAVGHAGRNDDDQQAVVGGVVGALAGATIGYFVCGGRAENQPPQVRASADPSSGDAPLSVSFRSVSSDADGQVVDHAWDFGDGTTASGPNADHQYTRPGTYTARVTVTDNAGLTASTEVPVRVTEQVVEKAAPQRIVLRGVNFDFDSAVIRPEAEAILETAAQVLKETPDVRVAIRGHTDSVGTDEYNQRLSERRANAVRDRLIALGIGAGRLTASGAGESEPVADNATADGRAQNRRVELNQQ